MLFDEPMFVPPDVDESETTCYVESVQQRIDLSSLEPGTYQALLIVDDGDNAVFGGQYELTL